MIDRRSLAAALVVAVLYMLPAWGEVAIELRYPRELFRVGSVTEFVTNDSVLHVEGDILSNGGPWTLTVLTPYGLPSLSAGSPALTEVTLDLGGEAMLTAVVFTPVIRRDEGSVRSYGVREFLLATALEEGSYTPELALASGSGVGSVDGRAVTRLDEARVARYVRLRWVSGWQRGADGASDVRLESVHLATDASPLAAARVVRFAAASRAPVGVVPFAYDLLLQKGRNEVSFQVVEDGADGADLGRSDTAMIVAELLTELPTAADAPVTFLSDGASLSVGVPPGAAPETLRGISLRRLDPTAVAPVEYRSNADIDSAYLPVLAYEFSGRFQKPFSAKSTASLPGQPASLAVDGRLEVPSTWMTNLAPFPITWSVNLRGKFDVASVVVHPRVEDGVSFGPQRASVFLGGAEDEFIFAGELADFPDGQATIELEAPMLATWVHLVIDEGKHTGKLPGRGIGRGRWN